MRATFSREGRRGGFADARLDLHMACPPFIFHSASPPYITAIGEGAIDVLKMSFPVLILATAVFMAQPALSFSQDLTPELQDESGILDVQDSGEVSLAPSEAADIAQNSIPGSEVLKVKLLPSGVYAVTLKADGSVLRVMVSAEDGAIQ
jgi:hypothetical protein